MVLLPDFFKNQTKAPKSPTSLFFHFRHVNNNKRSKYQMGLTFQKSNLNAFSSIISHTIFLPSFGQYFVILPPQKQILLCFGQMMVSTTRKAFLLFSRRLAGQISPHILPLVTWYTVSMHCLDAIPPNSRMMNVWALLL